MYLIENEGAMLSMFRDFERAEVAAPQNIKYPMVLRDHFTWQEPSGHRTYLLVHDQQRKQPLGVVFKRTSSSSDAPVMMCEWCHCVRGGNAVDLLTATVSTKKRVGAYLCRRLDCEEHRTQKPGVNDMRESISPLEKRLRLHERMLQFVNRNLF